MEESKRKAFIPLLLVFVSVVYSCDLPEFERFRCGYNIKTKEQCWAKNCCYDELASGTTPKCYFRRKDAAGGPIRHSNGLCVYPKNGATVDGTQLVWSSNCLSKNAVFLVSHDYPTYHIVSGKCILPKNGRLYDPGDNTELVLGTKDCKKDTTKFRQAQNGNLEYYYLTGAYKLCIGDGPSSSEPAEGEPVIFPESACAGVKNCQQLTYVYQVRLQEDTSNRKRFRCQRNFSIRVIWANYGQLETLIPAKFKPEETECTTNRTTDIMRRRCNGKDECRFFVRDRTFGINCMLDNNHLVIHYTCERNTKPAAPTVTVDVLGETKLRVSWSSVETRDNDPINGYSICWKTALDEGNCDNRNISSSSRELMNLKPSTMYFVYVATRSCEGGIGNYSETQIGITRAVKLQRSRNGVSSTSFVISLGKLQSDDKYIQIIVKKQTDGKLPLTSPDKYSPSVLQSPSEASSPYIAAELSKDFVKRKPKFTIGDDKSYSQSSNRKRRSAGSVFLNKRLEPGSFYSVFQRTFKNDNLFYNSEWMDVVRTTGSPTLSSISSDRTDRVSTRQDIRNTEPSKRGRESGGGDGGGGGSSAIIGAAASAVVVLILIVALFILWHRRRRRAVNNRNRDDKPITYEASAGYNNVGAEMLYQGIPSPFMEADSESNDMQVLPGVVYAKPDKNSKKNVKETENITYANVKATEKITYANVKDFDDKSPQIKVSRFLSHVEDMKKNKNFGFEEKFKELPVGQLYPWDVSKKPINVEKNRYGNIVTYDHSRVVLSGGEDEDYINASFVDGIKPDIYIASQAPTKKTVKDFWRMIWEQNSNSIISLTNIAEMGRIKCFQYWPNNEATFGKIHVTTLKTELFADYIIRNLKMEKDGETKQVKQYHFTSWPDHGVPKYPTQLLGFRRRFKALHTEGSQPIIVHCSAGVGRTGTFIALDMALERLSRMGQQTIDIYDTVQKLRTRRVNMVQTLEQYIFVHDAVLESILCGVTEIEAENLKTEIERLEQRELNKSLTGFELEFKKLNSVCAPLAEDECNVALKKENQFKNRDPHIYPADNLRVPLSRGSGGESSSYINATYVHGYTQNRAYIATQTPLPDTINDFWRMVFEKKATVIVMLNNLEEGKMIYPNYWPESIDKDLEYGELFVKMVSTDTNGPVVSRKFIVKSTIQNPPVEHVVRHVQFTDWPENGAPPSDNDVMSFLETVEEAQQRSANGVVIVHCSNGAHRTGTYLTLAIQRERIKTEHVVDVFRCIKMLRGQRPQFVGNVDQYKFCYRAMMRFVEYFNTYDNIPKPMRD